MAELTLQLDQELFQKVNQWAESRGISVNEAIAILIRQVPNINSLPEPKLELSPWTQSLVAVPEVEGKSFEHETLQQQYLDYLEEKYQ